MRTVAQVFVMFGAVSGLVCVFAAWAATPGLVFGSLLSLVVCVSTALLLAFIDHRRPKRSLFGPVQKWGVSEDAIHERAQLRVIKGGRR